MSEEQQIHSASPRSPSGHTSRAGQHARFTGEMPSSDRSSWISSFTNNDILQPLNEEGRSGNSGYVPQNYSRVPRYGGNSREETWMDFLLSTGSSSRNMSTGSSTIESVPNATSRFRPLPVPGLGLPRNLNMNMPHSRPELMDRKRRTMASEAQPSRRNSSQRWSYTQGTEPQRSFQTERRAYPAHSYMYGQTPLPATTAGLNRQSVTELGSRGPDDHMQSYATQEEIVLPTWQPDSDVSECFVCGTQFSFFFRKHHCRKCGRVVCANCSPHRITIPNQFIVQPSNPGVLDTATRTGSPTSGTVEGEDGNLTSAVSGGEEVRVCNPCVPDPNLSPPSRQQWPEFIHPPNPQPNAHNFSLPSAHAPRSLELPAPQIRNYQRSNAIPPFLDMDSIRRSRYFNQIQQRSSASAEGSNLTPSLLSNRSNIWYQDRSNPDNLSHLPLPEFALPHPSAFRHTRDHRSEGNLSFHGGWDPYQFTPLNINGPLPPLPSMPFTSGPPPSKVSRREISEEDECPVCGNELPARGLDGSETAREAHVQDCIGAHFTGPSSAPATTVQQPRADDSAVNQPSSSSSSSPNVVATNTTVTGTAGVATAADSSPRNLQHDRSLLGGQQQEEQGQHAEQTVPRPRRVTGTRMLTYHATEKDCSSVEGTAAECVICFEEYEVGDEMGRLECLCRFHKKCIREWWDVKGYGSCPTHQIHD